MTNGSPSHRAALLWSVTGCIASCVSAALTVLSAVLAVDYTKDVSNTAAGGYVPLCLSGCLFVSLAILIGHRVRYARRHSRLDKEQVADGTLPQGMAQSTFNYLMSSCKRAWWWDLIQILMAGALVALLAVN